MIKVIWSDDIFESEQEKQASIEDAYGNDIIVVAVQTWEEALKELESAGDSYDGIILDGRGQRNVDSKTNDSAHLTQAISWISEQRGMGKYYPTIIHTGYYEAIHDLYGEDKNIVGITNKPDTAELFRLIKEASVSTPNLKIRQKYSDLWGIFNFNILDSSKEALLLSIIRKLENETFKKSDFNSIREVFEALLKKFNALDNSDNLLPNDVLKNDGTINLGWSLMILKGIRTEIRNGSKLIRTIPEKVNPVIPKKHHIGYCFDFVKDVSSALSHDYQAGFGKTMPFACLNALLEILNWSNKLIQERYIHLL
ncbi:hypothetical protein [Emticicia sp. W12TSBA100-4]|uniref:hypothetical protein n=1 Tax=Emticicia sp. W12TSBA100-4 TaxID=3160965 RepID=UPI003305BCD3